MPVGDRCALGKRAGLRAEGSCTIMQNLDAPACSVSTPESCAGAVQIIARFELSLCRRKTLSSGHLSAQNMAN